MEKQSYELTSTIQLCVNPTHFLGQVSGLFAMVSLVFIFQSLLYPFHKNIELIHLGDALLSFRLSPWKGFPDSGIATRTGRLVFGFKPYQLVIRLFRQRLDRIICVSTSTQHKSLSVEDLLEDNR